MNNNTTKSVAVIVAHPDDETLWAGGTILSHPLWECFIVCLCRKSDAERTNKFKLALEALRVEGIMGDINDGPEQFPLDDKIIENMILELLPKKHFDIIISHNIIGEYTRHIRHEETGKAVIRLWNNNAISAKKMMLFAYDDNNKNYHPRATENATICNNLSEEIWLEKYNIIANIYGFPKGSFEEETTPHTEAFWEFNNPVDAKLWLGKTVN